ncbi:MAG: AAA family ATPase [Chloroflexi bacterium]|nr:AAA family ATPase [Chloroflexota bacterium]
MSVWIRNLKTTLEDREVVILHGNVRDKYIDDCGQVYDNLTTLLTQIAKSLPNQFEELVFYDAVGHERKNTSARAQTAPRSVGSSELAVTQPAPRSGDRMPPPRVIANWVRQLSAADQDRFVVLYYLDKLVCYKTSYTDEEKETLLWLEKLIENIAPNHRLILVALQDTLVPIELYTHSPKTYVLSIPRPDKADRLAYLHHRLGNEQPHVDLIGDLSDGLFLRDLDHIAAAVASQPQSGVRDVRRLVNKYRIGEQEDYWGTLSIERLNGALKWFRDLEGVKGQDEAVRKVVDMLSMARAGLTGVASGSRAKPKGVLFFAGPTGVGKTFVAKKLAKFLFSTEEAFIRLDMSEFKEEHTVSKLIGSPPGYVGYEKGGMLTNAVREKPFSVVLFDEIEKAHPKIMDIFLQLLDEGRLTDSRGQTVFFTETVIIFTSNLGARTTDGRGALIAEREELDAIIADREAGHEQKKSRVREHFTRAVERFFMYEISRPELLNRIGNNIVPFNYIHSPEVQQDIVVSHLKRIKEDFEDKYRAAGHSLSFEEPVAHWMVERHGEHMTLFGGRGITNAIEGELMMPLARAVLAAEHYGRHSARFRMHVANGRIGVAEE